jgi:hypothetical protein
MRTLLPVHNLLWHHAPSSRGCMAGLLEYVGYVHIYLGPYRGNPIALYLLRSEKGCRIGPKAYPWNDVVGIGDTPNKAAADFEEKWKGKGLSADMYSGPSWEGGIKPEKPAPPKPAAPAKPAAPPGTPAQPASATPSGSPGTASAPSAPTKAPAQAESPANVPGQTQPGQSRPVAPAPDGTEQSAASPASPPAHVKAQPATKPPTSTVPHGAPKS